MTRLLTKSSTKYNRHLKSYKLKSITKVTWATNQKQNNLLHR